MIARLLPVRGSAGTGRNWRAPWAPLARWLGRRQVLYSAVMLVTGCGLMLGVTVARQIVNGSGNGSAATGTVSLGAGPDSHVCDYGFLSPGDLTGSATCSLSITYTGSIDAFLSLTVRIRSRPGPGGRPLYDGTNASGLTMMIRDGRHSYLVPTGRGIPCGGGFTCWSAEHDLAASYMSGPHDLVFRNGDVVTFTLRPFFAAAVGNAYQGARADVTLAVQAVQAPANPLPASCNASTIGRPCPASGTFTWS